MSGTSYNFFMINFFRLFLKGSDDTVYLRDVANMELNNTFKNLA